MGIARVANVEAFGPIYCYLNGSNLVTIKKDGDISQNTVFFVTFPGDTTQTKYYGRLAPFVNYYFVPGGKYWPL